ncbi:subtilisin-like protein [Clavulina sp. PMI_390]|nr:subtilisin-like protein [Clavulina sp. PMI_390]
MTFTFVLKGQDYVGLTARMESIASARSKWLSDDELKSYVGPVDGAATAVNVAMQQMAGRLVSTSPYGDKITVNATIAAISRFFEATFFKFEFAGQDPVHRTMNYTIPSALVPFVSDIYPISTFGTVSPVRLVSHSNTTTHLSNSRAPLDRKALGKSTSSQKGCSSSTTTLACYRSLYGFDSYQPGSDAGMSDGPAVGVVAYIGQNFSPSDLTLWMSKYRPDGTNYQMGIIDADGAMNNPANPGVEAALDTQTIAGLIYPLPSIFYDIGPAQPTGDVFLLTFQRAIEMTTPRPRIITISYGSDEVYFSSSQASTMCQAAQQLTALGITIVVSSGDSGVDGEGDQSMPPFRPTYPGGCPFILSVGATQNFGPEVMADTTLAGFYSGSGFSTVFQRPSYQENQVQQYISSLNGLNDGQYNTAGRAFPDISAQGSRQPVVHDGTTYLVGGTSASAPIIAGGLALINDLLMRAGKPSIGWTQPVLYNNPQAFTDVTNGGSYALDGAGNQKGFPAGTGWDAASGLGTPIFSALRAAYGV